MIATILLATLAGFPALTMASYLALNSGVQSDGVEGGHVESLSGSWAPAADGSLSMGLAAVPRGQAAPDLRGWLGLGVLETARARASRRRARLRSPRRCLWRCSSRCRTAGTGPSLRCAAF